MRLAPGRLAIWRSQSGVATANDPTTPVPTAIPLSERESFLWEAASARISPPLPEATAGCKAALARVRQAKDHLRVVMEEAEWEGFN